MTLHGQAQATRELASVLDETRVADLFGLDLDGAAALAARARNH